MIRARTNSTGWFQLERAAALLRRGGVVAHATEGVWGLACDPFDARAVARVLALKDRAVDQGLIVIGAGAADFRAELDALDPPARASVEADWPGPFTVVVPNQRFPRWITGRHAGVAIRVPGHPQARALCQAFGGPLVSTSANPSGRAAATTKLKVSTYFNRCWPGLDAILPGQVMQPGAASSVRDLAAPGWIRPPAR